MKDQNSGQIVAISSMSALHPSPFAVEYSATKAAVNCYMKALGEKLRIQKMDGKIKTTCVCPYYITTRKDVIDFLNPE
jgi:all-trans-retinol dehydrogenase (NAD+)